MSEDVTGKDILNAGKGIAEMSAGTPPSLQDIQSTAKVAKPLSKGLLIGCLAQVLIFGFAILVFINTPLPPTPGQL